MDALAQAKEMIDKGLLKEALSILRDQTFEKEEDEIEALALHAKINMLKGEFDSALEYAEKAVSLSVSRRDYIINLKDRILQLGDLWKQGKFKECYEIMTLTKEKIREGVDLDTTQEAVARSYESLGILNYNQGLFEDAIQNLSKALHIIEKYGLRYNECQILFYLALSYIETNDEHSLQKTRDLLENNVEFCAPSKTELMLIDAMYAKTKSTWKEKVKAEEYFEQILKLPDLKYEMHVFTLTQYCDLLLEQLRSVDNAELLEKTKRITRKIYDLAKSKESNTLLVNVLLLEAKFAILEMNLDHAYDLLDQAKTIAEKKNMVYHLLQIRNLKSIIENELEEVEIKIRKNLRLKERLDMMTYQDFLDLAINTTPDTKN